ncbi:MAG: pitrilysin family protein [Ignavibacteria bacterium]
MKNINITKLPSGITIVSEYLPYVKSFSLGFWFNVGSVDENKKNNGISHFLEHMFFKGTKKRSAKRIADDIESLGGYLNAFTSKEHTCFYGRGLTKNLPKTFDVLADMIQNPLFRQKDIDKEANVVIDELYDIEDTPEELIFDKFETVIYDKSSLALPIIGTENNLKNFKPGDLFGYIEKKYANNKLYIVASGDVNHDLLLELTSKYVTKDFGKSPKRKNYKLYGSVKDSFVSKNIQQVHTIIGTRTVGFNNKQRNAVNILSHILGEGSSARLFQSLRERNGIAYQVNTFLNSFYDVSTFGVYLSTNEKMIKKSYGIIEKEFERIKTKKVPLKELNRAKEYLKGSILMGLESTTNRMTRMGQSMLYFNKVKSVEESINEINLVDQNVVLELANRILQQDNFTRVVIGSGDKNIN